MRNKTLQYFGSVALSAIVYLFPAKVSAQSPFKGFENLFTTPKSYVVNYVKIPPVIDGNINDAVWQQAAWTTDFEDIEGDLKPHPSLQTNIKMLWGDSCLYVAARIKDPDVWSYLTHHDDIVFRDNDFELFIDPENTTHRYFEIEVNARNTIFDLFLNKPYRNGGSPLVNWDVQHLQSAVKVQGTMNNPADKDEGWTVEMAIPFKSIMVGDNIQPPKDGSFWRINFSRVEWDTKVVDGKYVKLKDSTGRNLPEHNWVWSPQGVINMHFPERWGYLKFSKGDDKAFEIPYAELQKQYLWLIYYKEQLWYKEHHGYNQDLEKFGLDKKETVNNNSNTLNLEATEHQFMAFINDDKEQFIWTINQEGLITREIKNHNE